MIEVLSRRIEEAAWEDVEARVVDARFLDGIGDGRFSHTFSTFMLCLAPEPEKIVEEMRRVTRGDGVLGLAVWGDPKFGAFVKPWEMACRQVGRADWTYPQLMDEDWTIEANVKRGLEGAGWKDVSVWEEECVWGWGSGEEVAGYFFEGGNPANERAVEAFRVTGGDVGEARKVFERVLGEEGGKESGEIELRVVATLATARK